MALIKLCNTAHQRAEFLVIQKTPQLLCPSKSSPWSKVRRVCTQWLPKNLASKSTLVHRFSPFSPTSSVGLLGVLTLNDVLSKCVPPVSLVLLIGTCLADPPGWLTHWSKLGAASRRLRLSALVHVRHSGFAVPLLVDVGLAIMFLCCSVVGLVLTVKNTCDVSNPVQVSFHFHRLCMCV